MIRKIKRLLIRHNLKLRVLSFTKKAFKKYGGSFTPYKFMDKTSEKAIITSFQVP